MSQKQNKTPSWMSLNHNFCAAKHHEHTILEYERMKLFFGLENPANFTMTEHLILTLDNESDAFRSCLLLPSLPHENLLSAKTHRFN
jgi:hypothetical protein